MPWFSSRASVIMCSSDMLNRSVSGGSPGGPLLMCQTSPLQYCTACFCVQLFDGVNWLLAHVVFVHHATPCQMPLKIKRDMLDVLLVLAVFLPQNSDVEDPFCGTSSTTKTSKGFGYDFLCLWFSLFRMTFSITLFKLLMRLMIL